MSARDSLREMSTHARFRMNAGANNVDPSLSAFSRNIELRVDAGVQSVLESIENVEDKGRILQHVRNLVLHNSTKSAYSLTSRIFESPLEKIFTHAERNARCPEIFSHQEHEFSCEAKPLKPTPLSQPYKTVNSQVGPDFLRILRSECGLDASKMFIQTVIQVKVLSRPKYSERTTFDSSCIQLDISFDKPVTAIWELTAIEGSQEGDILWFGGRVALMAMAMATSLEDLRISVTAKTGDGRSQFLGLYTISSILPCSIDPSLTTRSSMRQLIPFMQHVSFVAEGTGALNLCRLKEKSEPNGSRIVALNTREKLAIMSVTVECKTELALSVARLKRYTDDSVDIRSSVEMKPASLGLLDDLLLTLEAETNTIHELASRSDAFGYTLSDIRQIMEMQMLADENIGIMEESFFGSSE